MASRFDHAVPETVWIVGTIYGEGTFLNFPAPDAVDENIRFTYADMNEELLTRFDEVGGRVWLQVEPGHADVLELIDILLNQYGHHPSVVGVGIDVEWFESTTYPEGSAVTDEQAAEWVAAVRKHNPDYQIFLKHWLVEKMPPTYRDGVLFIDDSQGFESFDGMVAEFSEWGVHFSGASVGYQFGYETDKSWWSLMDDPMAEIGQRLVDEIPNTVGLYWVDFTIFELVSPEIE
jgi:hypothetical protein